MPWLPVVDGSTPTRVRLTQQPPHPLQSTPTTFQVSTMQVYYTSDTRMPCHSYASNDVPSLSPAGYTKSVGINIISIQRTEMTLQHYSQPHTLYIVSCLQSSAIMFNECKSAYSSVYFIQFNLNRPCLGICVCHAATRGETTRLQNSSTRNTPA